MVPGYNLSYRAYLVRIRVGSPTIRPGVDRFGVNFLSVVSFSIVVQGVRLEISGLLPAGSVVQSV